MKSTIILAVAALAAVFGLLFAARSLRRLCQGRFGSAAAAFFLMVILLIIGALFFNILSPQSKTKPCTKDNQIKERTEKPQQGH
jgi:hypothetical protein